jgi:excisionase family DNA binding protein
MRRIERERKLSKFAPPVAPPDCPLLTLNQAALVAGRRPNTLRKLIHEGKIGCYRDGIQIRIPMTELNRYMTAKLMYVPATAGV